jgi:hypothetical protein
MNSFRNLIFLGIIFICGSAFVLLHVENKLPYKYYVVATRNGDLNNDHLPDSVVVLREKSDEDSISKYRLKVFFKKAQNRYQLVVSTDSAIEPARNYLGTQFGEIVIANNVLTLRFDLLRGASEHIFRYQIGNFELIGYTLGLSNGQGTTTEVDFNLSTGKYIRNNYNYETGSLLHKFDTVIKIMPLPKLQNFNSEKTDYVNF